jgi:hypothetical protein
LILSALNLQAYEYVLRVKTELRVCVGNTYLNIYEYKHAVALLTNITAYIDCGQGFVPLLSPDVLLSTLPFKHWHSVLYVLGDRTRFIHPVFILNSSSSFGVPGALTSSQSELIRNS